MMYHAFSQEDVRELARNPSEHTKVKLIEKLMLGYNEERLNTEERIIADDIIRLLAGDLSISIRTALSRKLADSQFLPHDVALRLATDLEDIVAIPAIERSPVLSEPELIEIIERSSTARQKAVARRSDLTDNLCARIAYETAPEVIEVLVKNYKAQIASIVSETIIKNHSSNEQLMRAMISNKRIDLTQAHDLLTKVSEDLRKLIIVEYDVPSTVVNNLVHDSKEWVILSLLKSHADEAPNSLPVGQIVSKLQEDGELSFSILIKGLSVGNLVFFEVALARMADVSVETIRELLWERNAEGYKAIYAKCGFPESMTDAMWELAKIVKNERQSHSPESLTQRIHVSLTKAAEAKQIRNIDYLVTIVSHNIRKLRK